MKDIGSVCPNLAPSATNKSSCLLPLQATADSESAISNPAVKVKQAIVQQTQLAFYIQRCKIVGY